jgi:5-carboxymethyl-2-hydroxymuconate isomerase
LKLPAGNCIFINPAYANQQEASIPMKLKVEVGDGEMQRRAFGGGYFELVIKKLKHQTKRPKITDDDINARIRALSKIIPSESEKKKAVIQGIQEVSNDILSDLQDIL